MRVLIGVNQKSLNPFDTKGFSRCSKIAYSRARGLETLRPLGMTGLSPDVQSVHNNRFYVKGVMAHRPLAGTGFFSKCDVTNRNVHVKGAVDPHPYVDCGNIKNRYGG